MENDNIRNDENMQETPIDDIASEEILPEVEVVTVAGDEVLLTEEEITEIKVKKSKKRKWIIAVSVIAAILLATAAFLVCYVEGVGDDTIVSNSVIDIENEEAGFWEKLKFDDIRYENPIVTLLDNVTGKNKNTVMKINGIAVSKGVFDYSVNMSAVNCIYTLIDEGWLESISGFDWDETEPGMNVTYLELTRNVAVETLKPIYATVALGEKNGVVLDTEDHQKIRNWIQQQKETYGDEFENELKSGGYNDEETLYEMQKIQLYMQKVIDDVRNNPSKYITESFKRKMDGKMITAKHILIGFETDENGNVSKEAKDRAKKTAEDVLKMVEAGEDFDALVAEYGADPGVTEDGYTFAHDGSMVKAFEDAAFLLDIGETSGLVETDYGYHIIKRVDFNISPDDYIELIQRNATINIKKSAYKNTKVTLDINAFFNEMIAAYTDEEATEEIPAE